MLTGFHGLHVTIGAIMLLVIWLRVLRGHFTPDAPLRLRGGRLVLALRRRGVARPVHLRLLAVARRARRGSRRRVSGRGALQRVRRDEPEVPGEHQQHEQEQRQRDAHGQRARQLARVLRGRRATGGTAPSPGSPRSPAGTRAIRSPDEAVHGCASVACRRHAAMRHARRSSMALRPRPRRDAGGAAVRGAVRPPRRLAVAARRARARRSGRASRAAPTRCVELGQREVDERTPVPAGAR